MLLSNWLKTFANRLRTPRRSRRVLRRDVQRSQQALLREVNNQVMCSSSSEVLEDRTLLAFDLMISATASAGVSIDDSVANQRTITATATGANIAVADVLAGFTAGRNVFISNGSTGAEAGNIIWTFTIVENDNTDLVIGTFNGLPQGASIANFLDSGLAATISYTGGMNSGGIRVANSNSPTIQNNALNRADVSSIGALYLTSLLEFST